RAEINARIDALEAKMDAKFAALDAKYDAKIDSVREDILALSKDLRHSGAIPRNNLARRRLVG
ncbi:MAG: host-nuclease inhibitor Gam family protein, partial [Cellulomonadaceae bacterium]|nr:host-nuclease inhibitor Gam family protein [Cellulomonadaceae bacterium]